MAKSEVVVAENVCVGEVGNDRGGSNGGNGGDNHGDVQDRGESCMLLFLIIPQQHRLTSQLCALLVLLVDRGEGQEMVS